MEFPKASCRGICRELCQKKSSVLLSTAHLCPPLLLPGCECCRQGRRQSLAKLGVSPPGRSRSAKPSWPGCSAAVTGSGSSITPRRTAPGCSITLAGSATGASCRSGSGRGTGPAGAGPGSRPETRTAPRRGELTKGRGEGAIAENARCEGRRLSVNQGGAHAGQHETQHNPSSD